MRILITALGIRWIDVILCEPMEHVALDELDVPRRTDDDGGEDDLDRRLKGEE